MKAVMGSLPRDRMAAIVPGVSSSGAVAHVERDEGEGKPDQAATELPDTARAAAQEQGGAGDQEHRDEECLTHRT